MKKRPTPLGMMSMPMKISITAFLLLSLLGVILTGVFRHGHTGFTQKGTQEYYRGTDENSDRLIYEKSKEELLETFHFHVFTMPLFYLALVHIFYLVKSCSERLKVIVTLGIFLGVAGELAAPALLVYAGAGYSRLFFVSGPLLLIGTVIACVFPLLEMWFIGKPAP